MFYACDTILSFIYFRVLLTNHTKNSTSHFYFLTIHNRNFKIDCSNTKFSLLKTYFALDKCH